MRHCPVSAFTRTYLFLSVFPDVHRHGAYLATSFPRRKALSTNENGRSRSRRRKGGNPTFREDESPAEISKANRCCSRLPLSLKRFGPHKTFPHPTSSEPVASPQNRVTPVRSSRRSTRSIERLMLWSETNLRRSEIHSRPQQRVERCSPGDVGGFLMFRSIARVVVPVGMYLFPSWRPWPTPKSRRTCPIRPRRRIR